MPRRHRAVGEPQLAKQAEALVEADAAQQQHRGHVARVGQRHPRQQRPHERVVGVGDAAGAALEVVHQGGGPDDAALERHGVEEGLERAPRRAPHPRVVDRPMVLGVEVGGRADPGQHLVTGQVQDDQGGVAGAAAAPLAQRSPGHLGSVALQVEVQRGAQDGRRRRRRRP